MLTPWVPACVYQTAPSPKKVIPAPAFYHQAGFSAGFLSVLIIATLLTGVYVQAGSIAELVPDLTPPLDQYKVAIDAARVWLDQQADQAVLVFEQMIE